MYKRPSSAFLFIKTVLLIKMIFGCSSLLAQPVVKTEQVNGIVFNGPKKPVLNAEMIRPLKETGANWIAFVPEATLDRSTLYLLPDSINHWWGETIEASCEGIILAKKEGLKVMLKPHIRLEDMKDHLNLKYSSTGKREEDKTRGASWRGNFSAKNKEDWMIWEGAYEKYILALATLADSLDVDLFCVGSELKKSAIKRPFYWRQLIEKVRAIYSGPLTYSANWDEYTRITFWDDLDYIGIDAYFPISLDATPKVRRTTRNWRRVMRKLKRFSNLKQRQILITEIGYRNVSFAGLRPWIHDKGKSKLNNKAQVNLYEAYFRAIKNKSWIAGSFFWQWFAIPKEIGNTKFSPQGKPAIKVLEKYFKE